MSRVVNDLTPVARADCPCWAVPEGRPRDQALSLREHSGGET